MRAPGWASLLVLTVASSVGCAREHEVHGESRHEAVDGGSSQHDGARPGALPTTDAPAGDVRSWRDEGGGRGGASPTPGAGGAGGDADAAAEEASGPVHEEASAGAPADGSGTWDVGETGAGDGEADAGATDAGATLDAPAAEADSPSGSGPVTDAGGASAASLWASVALPAFDAATVAHVKALRARGVQLGNRPDVFARCGDSITAMPSFLVPVGLGAYQLGAYAALETTIAAYRASALPGGTNSFTHSSQCAVGGWTTQDALAAPGAIAAELEALGPAILLVLFGTNDSQKISVDQFSTNLNQIAVLVEAQGVVLVLSTAPPRTDYPSADAEVGTFNAAIKRTASARHLPLIELHAALAPLPGQGIGGDGVHPTVEMVGGAPASGDFTSAGLQYGSNMHNLLAVQMLDRLRSLQ